MNCTHHATNWRKSLGAFALVWATLGPAAPPAAASSEEPAEPAQTESVEVSEVSASGVRGVKLGEFKIRTSNTVSSRKDGVSFTLHAMVKNDDYKAFERLYPRRKNKVRDQVVVATRLVPIDDYDDPELGKFRRRILLRLRRTVPELPIADVYISDFTLAAESL